MPPAGLLDDLAPEQAAAKPIPGGHSIVEILAHVVYWQAWFIDRCEGRDAGMAATASIGWPAAGAEDWEPLKTRFLKGLETAVALEPHAANLLDPPINFPPLAHYTVRDGLTHVAVHNAHHLGQIVTLRQLLGAWPPPQGSWTW